MKETSKPVLAVLPLALGLMASGPADAAITFVDATSGTGGNTTLANGSTFSPPLNGTTGADNNWERRTTFGTGGSIFEAGGEVAENAPELRTRISGLTAGYNYNIFVYFYDPGSAVEDWNIRAATVSNAGANTLYSAADATGDLSSTASILASTQTFSGTAPTFVDGGTRILLSASLGVFTADINGQIDIFIDDRGSAPGGVNQRTWYDGVGFEFNSVPEPTIALLGSLGLLGLMRRRR